MNPTIKQIMLLFFLTLFTFAGKSQTNTISFGYDAAGNRVSRAVPNQLRSATQEEEETTTSVEEVLSDVTIKIYPNPTEGIVTVEINSPREAETNEVSLYSLSGKNIIPVRVVERSANLDISEQPAGVYILKIRAGEQHTEWKIIKK